MKKLFATLVAFLAIFQISYAQWTGGPTGPISYGGNVGIGTSNPTNFAGFNGLTINNTSGSLLDLQVSGTTIGRIAGIASGLYVQSINGPLIFSANGADRMKIDETGNIGIGTNNPQGKLDIFNSTNTANTPLFSIRSNFHVAGNYGMIKFGDYTQTTDYQKGAIIYESVAGSARGKFHIALEDTDSPGSVTLADSKLTILSNGNVGIGTLIPSTKLAVNGKIRAQEIKVETLNWPDYVFKSSYTLPTLSEVKTFIERHQHLPEMPSAIDAEQNGINLGDLVRLQTKKIEELTLYLIDKDTQLKTQQTQIDELKAQMVKLLT